MILKKRAMMLKKIGLFAVGVSSYILSAAAQAYDCASLAQYANGQTYTTGQKVKNANHAYNCTVGGWCTVGGPYEPGVGWAWTNAWSDLGACGAVASSSKSASSIPVSSSSSSVKSSVISSSKISSSSISSSIKSSAISSSTATSVSSSIKSSSSSLVVSSSSSSKSSTGAAPIYSNNFNQHAIGTYTASMFTTDWASNPGTSAGVSDGRLNIVADPATGSGRALRVTYRNGQIGGSSASVFTYNIPGGPHTQLWFQYKVMFDQNFTWVKGGKLPGLAGFTGTKPTGCVANSELNGFSARAMWRENGQAFQYLYTPEKKEECGDYSAFYFFFTKGRWHTITSHITLGGVGQHDGAVTSYVDGKEVLTLSNLLLRNSSAVSIDKLLFETFFGGSTAEWAPASDQYSYFDDITISTTSRLSDVTTQTSTPEQGSNHPLAGYNLWQTTSSYSQNSRVYARDESGFYHYYQARYGIAQNKNPLQNSLPENYVGIYNPVRLDNGQPWVELTNP